MAKKSRKPLTNGEIIVRYTLSIVLSVTMVIGTVVTSNYADLISNVLDAATTKTINPVEDIYQSDYDSYEDLVTHEEDICKQVEEEGMVLLKNENNTLPFSSDVTKISVFGQDSADFVYGGSGSGSVSADKAVTLQTALESAGYTLNPELVSFYTEGSGKDYRKTYPSETGAGEFAVNEAPLETLLAEVSEASMQEYSDAALVVIGRSGGESADLPTEVLSTGTRYLELDSEEAKILQYACDNFDKVVVIINASNAMELGFLEEYDVDACLWTGAVGQTGIYAIGEALNGTINPSGRLVDTYAYDSTTAPSFVNLGDYTITNANEETLSADKYMVYGEGIYVGYRYYETRYEDVVLGTENAGEYDYASQVQYPFGYGLSYTSFSYQDYEVTENEDSFVISVTVTNTGSVAGKDVVEVYMQSPYTDYDIQNQIEKSSVELVGFAKTQELQPEASETVSIEVDKENMKAYDANGAGTYILDAGTYYFALGSNAHEALNNILAAKGYTTADKMTADGDTSLVFSYEVNEFDNTTYAVSLATGSEITNQFEDADICYYDETYTYLTRSNWMGSWPSLYQGGAWEAPEALLTDLEFDRSDEVVNDGSSMPETGEEVAVTVSELNGKDYDDPLWDDLLNALTLDEMTRLVRMGGYATIAIDSISLPGTTDKDGTSGFSSSVVPGRSGTGYPAEVVMAATWNTNLVKEVGLCIGEDSLALEITGWYAPGIDIHRSPYSGRNFEYFSEDGFLSGMMGASEISGAREKGCIAYMKHFALNDQETNRYGVAIFANEQAIREVFLKGFELVARNSDVTAVMASMNRIGAKWSGAHKGLMTETLREEWGFDGTVITDQASVAAMLYQDIVSGLDAGNSLWLNTNNAYWSLDEYKENATVMNNVRNAAHDIIYMVANSNAINGISPDSKVVSIIPWWQKLLYAADAVVWTISVVVITATTAQIRKRKKTAISVETGSQTKQ